MTTIIPSKSIPLTVMGRGSSFPQTHDVGKFYIGNVEDDKFTANEIITWENTAGRSGGFQWFGWRSDVFSSQKLRITFWIKFMDSVPEESENFGIKVYGALFNDFVKQCQPNRWYFVEKTIVCPEYGDGNIVLFIFDSINHMQTVRVSQPQIQISADQKTDGDDSRSKVTQDSGKADNKKQDYHVSLGSRINVGPKATLLESCTPATGGNVGPKATKVESCTTPATGGLKYMKVRMRELDELIEQKNMKSIEAEERTVGLKKNYARSSNDQKLLCMKIFECEERLEKVERDLKDTGKRLYDKEIYLREIKNFEVGSSIKEALAVDEKLLKKKQAYKETYEKFQKSKQRKITVENQYELTDVRSRAVHSKLNALQAEIHHATQRKERYKQECIRSSDASVVNSDLYEKMERDMEAVRKRIMDASNKNNGLTIKIAQTETQIRSMNFNRIEMENSIKRILVKVQQQMKGLVISEEL